MGLEPWLHTEKILNALSGWIHTSRLFLADHSPGGPVAWVGIDRFGGMASLFWGLEVSQWSLVEYPPMHTFGP